MNKWQTVITEKKVNNILQKWKPFQEVDTNNIDIPSGKKQRVVNHTEKAPVAVKLVEKCCVRVHAPFYYCFPVFIRQ